PSTAPTTQQSLAERRAVARKVFEERIADAPGLPGPRAIDELLVMSIDKDGMLVIRPKLGKIDRSRVEVTGIPAPALFTAMGDQANTPDGISVVQFETNDFNHGDDVFRRIQLFASAASMQLALDVESMSSSYNVTLIHSYVGDDPESAAKLYV